MRFLRTLPLLAAIGVVAVPAIAVPPAAGAATAPPRPAFVFVSDRDGDSELFVRRTDGSDVQLTRNRTSDFGPAWSPDGRRIAFSRQAGDGAALFVMKADGTGVRRLGSANAGRDEVFPAWTADGRSVLYWRFSSIEDPDEAIFRIDADGTDRRRLTGSGSDNFDPDPYPVAAR